MHNQAHAIWLGCLQIWHFYLTLSRGIVFFVDTVYMQHQRIRRLITREGQMWWRPSDRASSWWVTRCHYCRHFVRCFINKQKLIPNVSVGADTATTACYLYQWRYPSSVRPGSLMTVADYKTFRSFHLNNMQHCTSFNTYRVGQIKWHHFTFLLVTN